MTLENGHQYDDIIHLPHHVSARHPQMSMADRAAQFSPFAALTGHEAVIQETARLTDRFIELDEDEKAQIDRQLQLLKENQLWRPEIEVTYFQPDGKKSGGAYVTVQGKVKRIDEYGRRILFEDGTAVSLEEVFDVSIKEDTL